MNKTVLVVDDDEPLRSSLCDVLADEGYLPVPAANGRDALDWLGQALEPPCLILLDLMMPVMNGWQFREEQMRHPALAAIPVVVITANGTFDRASLDVAEIIRKPLKLQTLIDTAQRYCPC